MVDAVKTVTTQSTALRASPQNAASAASVDQASGSSDAQFVTSTIRVDNLQNVAILEYRSSNGEVVQQYPTQSQIDAFKRAEQAHTKPPSTAHHEEVHQAAASPSPAPQQPHKAAPAEHHAETHHTGGGSNSTHSVVA